MRTVIGDRVDEIVREFFAADIPDADALVEVLCVVANRVQKVSFPEPRSAVDKKWVVSLRRCFCYGHGSGVGKTIRGPDDEAVEGVFIIQPRELWGADGLGVHVLIQADFGVTRSQRVRNRTVARFDVGINNDDEVFGVVFLDALHRGHQRDSHALLQHSPREFVGNFEVQHTLKNTTGFHEVQKTSQLRRNPIIGGEVRQYRRP